MLTTKDNNKAISKRENTMRTWKLAALALVLGLVFCGAANAAVTNLAISIEVVDAASVTPGSDFTVNIWGLISGMDAVNIADGYGGIASAAWTIYTPGTVGAAVPKESGLPKKVVTTFEASYSAPQKAIAQDYDLDGDKDAVNMALSQANVTDYGIVKTLLGTQTWTLVGTSAVLAVVQDPQGKYIDEFSGELDYTTYFDTFTNGLDVTVGASGNTLPTVGITEVNGAAPDAAGVLETDWSTEPGWNNPLHTVTVTALGADGESDPLTYAWTMTKPGEDPLPLTGMGTDGVLTLTIADIASLGLPPVPGVGEIWNFSVVANDGPGDSAPAGIDVFVPEPATIGLLAFGVVGLLKRRRRA